MKFTSINLVGLTTIELPIIGASMSDPYILKTADGLGPPVVDVSISNTLFQGGIFQGSRPQNREITMLVKTNPNYSINQTSEDLRTELYGLLTPGLSEEIIFELRNDGVLVATTSGYIKRIEPSLFSKEPQVQIVLSCLGPYFTNMDGINQDLGTLSKSDPIIENVGTASSGFYIKLTFTSPVSSWTIYNEDQSKKMLLEKSFITGESLIIDTRSRYRRIYNIKSGTTYTMLYALSSDSDWLKLHGGVNTFSTSSQNFNWDQVYFRPQYWGV